MEVKNYGYSLKNIPMPSKSRYLKCMVDKVECFIRRLRWKAYHFCKENGQDDNRRFTEFDFKTPARPPQNEYLNTFENDMYEIIRTIEMASKTNSNKILRQLDHQKMY